MGKGLTSSRLTADGAVTGATRGWLRKVAFTGNAASEILVYDGTGVTGTLICRQLQTPAALTTYNVDFPGAGRLFETGLYVDFSGGTTACELYWDQ